MKFIEPPVVGAFGSARSGDDLDGLLRAFYRAEMPHPWPELEPPAYTTVPSSRLAFWRGIKRSHLALAASVALLIGGALLFSGKLPVIGTIVGKGYPSEIGRNTPEDHQRNKVQPNEAIDPDNILKNESIVVTPEGAGVRFEGDDRY
jgi:hypothetical protein